MFTRLIVGIDYPRPLPPPPRVPLLLEPPPLELRTDPELRDGEELRTELDRDERFTELEGLDDLFTELFGLDDLFTELLGRVFRTEVLLLRFTLLLGREFRTELLFLTLLLLFVALADLRAISDRA